MSEMTPGILSKMDMALEEACQDLPGGGSHAQRKMVAESLLEAAREGRNTIGEFGIVARKAVAEFGTQTKRPTTEPPPVEV
jgi:hypothetical protein